MSRMRSEIEGVAAEHLIERDLRLLGAVQLGVRVDAAECRPRPRAVRHSFPGLGPGRARRRRRSGSWPRGRPSAGPSATWRRRPSPLASSLALWPTFSSTKKVCATGAGSASPVVSTMMASNLPLRRIRPSMMRIRSPRTVHFVLELIPPPSSAPTTSLDADLAEFVDDHASLLAARTGCGSSKRWACSSLIAGHNGHRDFLDWGVWGTKLVRTYAKSSTGPLNTRPI